MRFVGLLLCAIMALSLPASAGALWPASPTPTASPTSLEQEMLSLVNEERTSRGLEPLEWDGALAEVGREHSKDMLDRDYFGHRSPDGQTPVDRARKAGIGYRLLGENVGFGPDLKTVHEGLMKSTGHRENILRPQFRRLGIGIVRIEANDEYRPSQIESSPRGGLAGYLLVTQVFAR